jgi:glycosyltransferase involved in cell wall biosynthesis
MKPRFDRSVSLLAWAYNEEGLIDGFLTRAVDLLEKTVDDFEIVVVDDGSTDATPRLLEGHAARDARIRVLTNDRNMNVGSSAQRAIRSARNEITFWQTVDWSYDFTHLRIFLELTRHFDVVQGIRPVPIRLLSHIPVLRSIYRVRRRSDNLMKAVVSLTNYYLLRILFGCGFQDFQNVTFYKRAHILDIDIAGTRAFSNPKLLFKTYEKGLTYLEVPIRFLPREQGEAKGTRFGSIVRSIAEILGAWLSWGWRFRLQQKRQAERRVFRVAEPFHLDEEVLTLVLPLFREYR